MGNHRADVDLDTRPSVTRAPYPSPYAGKRRAHPVEERTLEERTVDTVAPASYVGRRRAAMAEPPPAPRVIGESRRQTIDERIDKRIDKRIDTATLRALVELELTDTAPRPRVIAGDGEAVGVPAPRRPVPDPTVIVDRPKPLFADESRIDLPRLSAAARGGLGSDTTTLLPALIDGGRRRASRRQTRRSFFRRLPSLPVVVGAAALAVSAVGVVHTTHTHSVTAAGGRLTGASALTGSSGTASVGSTGTDVLPRSTPLSRDTSRSAADAAAEERAQALDKLDAQAAGQDKYLHSNVWVLPISAGVYHLTGRFGDVSGLWATVHTGLDFAAPYGTPIHSIARGVVTFTGYDGAYGNKTVITLPDGTEIWYCHQSQFAVSVGDSVDQNEVIGYVGATGNTTGAHVHIEVRPGGGDPVDPDPAFREHGVDPDANQ